MTERKVYVCGIGLMTEKEFLDLIKRGVNDEVN